MGVTGERAFTREEIDRVKRENPIEEVVARYVALRRRGRTLVGLCPFHQETEPSFTVTPAMERWHCFGACGAGGDVIDFVVRITGDSFAEAMERLGAQRLPPPVPVPASWRGLGRRESRELTHDDRRLIKAAAILYHTAFFLHPPAVQYVIGRGISIPTAQRHLVGYARGDRLVPYLSYKGLSVGRALDLGLLRSVPPQAGLRSVPPQAGLRSVPRPAGLRSALPCTGPALALRPARAASTGGQHGRSALGPAAGGTAPAGDGRRRPPGGVLPRSDRPGRDRRSGGRHSPDRPGARPGGETQVLERAGAAQAGVRDGAAGPQPAGRAGRGAV